MTANRDEFHRRPAKASHFWPHQPHVLAGIDLEGGGTWMGVSKDGYFSALTNVRQIPAPASPPNKVSRGQLVADYLIHQPDPLAYLQDIHRQAHLYEGFNLIVGNRQQCFFLSNRNTSNTPLALAPGLYGLSNAALNSPWPKNLYAKQQLRNWIQNSNGQALHSLLNSRDTYPKHELPDTGIGQPWESLLSAAFITSPEYGTRASTGLQIHTDGIEWQEASYNPQGQLDELIDLSF